MKSVTTLRFRACFDSLPLSVKKSARKTYELWKEDASHPGLQFKLISSKSSVYSVRVNLGYRALGIKEDDTIIWFWIGSHASYDELIKSFS